MPISGTTQIAAKIAPTSLTDTYATHDSTYGAGSWQEVPDLTARDAITAERRHQGMAVWVTSENKLYILKTGVTNSDWVEFIGSGGDVTGTLTPGKLPVATGTKTLSDSSITQSGSNIYIAGTIGATNLSGTNTGDQDLTNMPTANQKAAMDNANSPTGANPFSTYNDRLSAINNAANLFGRTYNGKPLFFSNQIIKAKTSENFFAINRLLDNPDNGTTETILPVYITQNPYSDFLISFKYAPSNLKSCGIYGGSTIGKIWARVSDNSYISYITVCQYHVKKYLGATVTITGSGTTRVVTSTNYPFIYAVNTDKRLAPYLETPKGAFQIIGSGGANFVTINTPASYVNETAVPFNQWIKITEVSTGQILQTISHEITCFNEPQPEYSQFTSKPWELDDEFAMIAFADTNSISDIIKVDLIFAGNTRYTHIDLSGFVQVCSKMDYAREALAVTDYYPAAPITQLDTSTMNAHFPEEMKRLLKAEVVYFVPAGSPIAGQTGKDIDTQARYSNDIYLHGLEQYLLSNFASTYTMPAEDMFGVIDVTALFAYWKAGMVGSMFVKTNSIGGTLDIIGLRTWYIK